MANYKHLIVKDEIHELVVKIHGEFLSKGINKSMLDVTSEALEIGLEKIRINIEMIEKDSEKNEILKEVI